MILDRIAPDHIDDRSPTDGAVTAASMGFLRTGEAHAHVSAAVDHRIHSAVHADRALSVLAALIQIPYG